MTDTPQQAAFRALIDEAHGALEARARRLFALEPFVERLTEASRVKRFTIHNASSGSWRSTAGTSS